MKEDLHIFSFVSFKKIRARLLLQVITQILI